MQKKRNSIANALELCHFCIKPSICYYLILKVFGVFQKYFRYNLRYMTHIFKKGRSPRDLCCIPSQGTWPFYIELIWRNVNRYLHFIYLLDIEMVIVSNRNPPSRTRRLAVCKQSILCLLMAWWYKKPQIWNGIGVDHMQIDLFES